MLIHIGTGTLGCLPLIANKDKLRPAIAKHVYYREPNRWQRRLVGMSQTGHVNLYEELTKGSKSP